MKIITKKDEIICDSYKYNARFNGYLIFKDGKHIKTVLKENVIDIELEI